MGSNVDVLKGTINTSSMSGGGVMNTVQAKKFIKMVFDTTELLKIVRTFTMKNHSQEFGKIGVGQRLLRGATEGEDVSNKLNSPYYGKIEMNVVKYVLPWEITEEAMEDSIEGGKFEDTVAGLFAEQTGLDLEDAAVNSDKFDAPDDALSAAIDAVVVTIPVDSTAGFPRTSEAGFLVIGTENISYTGKTATSFTGCTRGENGTTAASAIDTAAVTWLADPLLGVNEGWLDIMYTGDASYVDLSAIDSGAISKAHFFAMLDALPKKYRRGSRKSQLRWLMSSHQYLNWQEYLTNRATAAGDGVLAGKDFAPLGIMPVEVSSFPDDTIVLTNPKNLLVGIWRQIKVRKSDSGKESIMEDKVFYNSTMRYDFEIEETGACVIGDGLV